MAAVAAVAIAGVCGQATAQAAGDKPIGVVANVKVLSDKVQDVSSLEAWKKSFIKEGMSDQDKALAVWKSNCMFGYQDSSPVEGLHEGDVHDAIKTFNVYGYGICCCAAARLESLSRYVGLEARGWGIIGHSVAEVKWDDEWHFLDPSLLNYFTKDDGKIASVKELATAIQDWLKEHEEYRDNDAKLRQFQTADGWTGWKKGPALLANCKFYDAGGWWPAKTHGWYSTMQEFSGKDKTPFPYEYGYSQGYQVNIRLREGEKLTRNWFNKGLHVNGMLKDGGAPGSLKKHNFLTAAQDFGAKLEPKYPDLNEARVGSGTLEYDVPLASGAFKLGALRVENIASTADDKEGPAIHLQDAAKQGILEIEMPTSYVYLTGKVQLDAKVGEGGKVRLFFSDNNGQDWTPIASVEESGKQDIDIQKNCLRRYDYRLRVILEGKGTGLDALRIAHDIQCSQRALPNLGAGDNTISFSAGPQEGTVTVEGTSYPDHKKKNVIAMDFHPALKDIEEQYFRVKADGASVTFPISTPGEMTRLRMGGHYRVREKDDQWEMQVSFDGGKTFKTVDTQTGPYQGICKYITVSDIPAGKKEAQVRWVGKQRNTTCLFLVRIDADYKLPNAGFKPVKVTYLWEEGGIENKDEHVASKADDTWTVKCFGKPTMKSIVLELAK